MPAAAAQSRQLDDLQPRERRDIIAKLVAAVHRAAYEGWSAYEYDEIVKAHARALDLRLSNADVASILTRV